MADKSLENKVFSFINKVKESKQVEFVGKNYHFKTKRPELLNKWKSPKIELYPDNMKVKDIQDIISAKHDYEHSLSQERLDLEKDIKEFKENTLAQFVSLLEENTTHKKGFIEKVVRDVEREYKDKSVYLAKILRAVYYEFMKKRKEYENKLHFSKQEFYSLKDAIHNYEKFKDVEVPEKPSYGTYLLSTISLDSFLSMNPELTSCTLKKAKLEWDNYKMSKSIFYSTGLRTHNEKLIEQKKNRENYINQIVENVLIATLGEDVDYQKIKKLISINYLIKENKDNSAEEFESHVKNAVDSMLYYLIVQDKGGK